MNVTQSIAALLLASAGLPALAGGTATLEATSQGGNTRMEVRWSGDNMRMDFSNQQGTYMLVRDGKSYSVTNRGGQPMVMDMSSMAKMADAMGGDQAGANVGMAAGQPKTVQNIEKTGDTATVAGIEGDVYKVEWTDKGGNKHSDTAVLSDDERVIGLTGAFRKFSQASGNDSDPLGQALAGRGLGVLRFGKKFRVASISDKTPAAAAFELPAEPMNMQKMMEGMGR